MLQLSKMKVYWVLLQIFHDIFVPVNSVLQKQQLSLYLRQKPATELRLVRKLHYTPMMRHNATCLNKPHGELHCSSNKKHMTRDNALDEKQTWTNANNLTQRDSTTAFLWLHSSFFSSSTGEKLITESRTQPMQKRRWGWGSHLLTFFSEWPIL